MSSLNPEDTPALGLEVGNLSKAEWIANVNKYLELGHKWAETCTTTTFISISLDTIGSDLFEIALATQTKMGEILGPREIRRILIKRDAHPTKYAESCKSLASSVFQVSQEYAVNDKTTAVWLLDLLISNWSLRSDEVHLTSFMPRHSIYKLGCRRVVADHYLDWPIWDSQCLSLRIDWPVKKVFPTFGDALDHEGIRTEGTSLQNAANAAWFALELLVREAQQASQLVSFGTSRNQGRMEDEYHGELYGPSPRSITPPLDFSFSPLRIGATEDMQMVERENVDSEPVASKTILKAAGSIVKSTVNRLKYTFCKYIFNFPKNNDVLANRQKARARIENLAKLLCDECDSLRDRVAIIDRAETCETMQQALKVYDKWERRQRWATEESIDMTQNWTRSSLEHLARTLEEASDIKRSRINQIRYEKRMLVLQMWANWRGNMKCSLAAQLLYDMSREVMNLDTLEKEYEKLLTVVKNM